MMKYLILFVAGYLLMCSAVAQQKIVFDPYKKIDQLTPILVDKKQIVYAGKKAVGVTEVGSASDDADRILLLDGVTFANGTIELELAGKPAATAGATARGFIGVAFRVQADAKTLECIYLRPTNGRAEDQVRRNHSVQYISHPDYPWHKLRKDEPKKYESYVDLVPGEWTKVRIEVDGTKARLYVHGQEQPTLLVNDLKLGADAQGGIGLWIGPGTEGYFGKITITPKTGTTN